LNNALQSPSQQEAPPFKNIIPYDELNLGEFFLIFLVLSSIPVIGFGIQQNRKHTRESGYPSLPSS